MTKFKALKEKIENIINYSGDFFIKYMVMKIYFSVLLFCLITLAYFFISDTESVIKSSNFAFAILIGFSSVCFSWSRNTEKDNDKRNMLNRCGEYFIYGSISFLCATGLTFIHRGMEDHATTIGNIIQYSGGTIMMYAYLIAAIGMWKIGNVLQKDIINSNK